MGSKNNLKLRSEKMAQRKAKYKIKKLNVGVASVMVGALTQTGSILQLMMKKRLSLLKVLKMRQKWL